MSTTLADQSPAIVSASKNTRSVLSVFSLFSQVLASPMTAPVSFCLISSVMIYLSFLDGIKNINIIELTNSKNG